MYVPIVYGFLPEINVFVFVFVVLGEIVTRVPTRFSRYEVRSNFEHLDNVTYWHHRRLN